MSLLKYLLSNHLIRVDSSLIKTDETKNITVPGLYDENNNLIKTWDQLVKERLVIIE